MEQRAPLRISIVTPSYNQVAFLEATLRSVLTQDYPHCEYIVVDGASTDGSVDVIRRYADRLAYWCSEPDGGQADALRKGFARATGDILCWINSDDILLPGALSRVATYFAQHPAVEAVSGGAYYIDANGSLLRWGAGYLSLGVPATYNYFRYYGQDGIFQQAVFWRREAYLAVGGVDASLRFIMDLDLFARLARRRAFGRLPHLLAAFRVHEACKTSTIQHVRIAETREFRRRHGAVGVPARFMYWRYRIPALARKAYTLALLHGGVVTP